MNIRPCDREPTLLQALRTNALTDTLRVHLTTCTSCRQTYQAASLVLRYASNINAVAAPPPSPADLWSRAQQLRRQAALQRISRLVFVMRTLGVVYLLAITVWSLRSLWLSQPVATKLTFVSASISPLTIGAVPLGITLALLLVLAGAASLLLLGHSQPDLPVSAT